MSWQSFIDSENTNNNSRRQPLHYAYNLPDFFLKALLCEYIVSLQLYKENAVTIFS